MRPGADDRVSRTAAPHPDNDRANRTLERFEPEFPKIGPHMGSAAQAVRLSGGLIERGTNHDWRDST